MTSAEPMRTWWRLVQRELLVEVRLRRTWVSMLVLGLVLVLLVEMQLDLPAALKRRVAGTLLWLDVFFAGVLALDRSFAGERENGCWRTLLLYPVSPTLLYFSKVTVLVLALALLELALIPALVVFAGVPMLDRPGTMALTALLANLGFAAVAVVAGAAATSFSQRGSVLALVILPLTSPVLIGASETTRLLLLGPLDEAGGRWLQFLAVAAVLFTTLGTLVFPCILEE